MPNWLDTAAMITFTAETRSDADLQLFCAAKDPNVFVNRRRCIQSSMAIPLQRMSNFANGSGVVATYLQALA